MISNSHKNIPGQWRNYDWIGLRGVVMVVGAPDVGKTTFSHFLFQQIYSKGDLTAAILDGDPGQSSLGPPTSLTLAFSIDDEDTYRFDNMTRRMFVGSTSPRGHMLPMLVGAARLVSYAQTKGVKLILYDTSGLIKAEQGGLSLKGAKIDLLQPATIIAIQINEELELLLTPYRRSGRVKIIDLSGSEYVIRRDLKTRQEYRVNKFKEYFSGSHTYELQWNQFAVFPLPRFSMNSLIALESEEGYLMALGIVVDIDRLRKTILVKTPLKNISKVNSIRIGDIDIDPETYIDRQIQ